MNIVVFCGSNFGVDPAYTQAAAELGRLIARRGHRLVYGGSSTGLMDVVADAVLTERGEVIGVETSFFKADGVAKSGLTELVVVDTMEERKERMIQLGNLFVALPGGMGTLDEVTDVACANRVGRGQGGPLVMLSLDGYYDPLREMVVRMGRAGFVPVTTNGNGGGALPGGADYDQLYLDRCGLVFVGSVAELAQYIPAGD